MYMTKEMQDKIEYINKLQGILATTHNVSLKEWLRDEIRYTVRVIQRMEDRL